MQKLIAVEIKDNFFGDHPIAAETYTGDGGIGNLISAILPNIFMLAGFILFVYLIFGGFLLISSSGDSKKTEEGKQALTNAIIGFAIIFTSYWIIQIIEVITEISIL